MSTNTMCLNKVGVVISSGAESEGTGKGSTFRFVCGGLYIGPTTASEVDLSAKMGPSPFKGAATLETVLRATFSSLPPQR